MLVNGEQRQISPGMTLAAFLTQEGYRQELVAVEYNGRVLRRTEYATTILDNLSTLEIVSFVGGG